MILTEGSQSLIAATLATLSLCWFVVTFSEWLAVTFRNMFRR